MRKADLMAAKLLRVARPPEQQTGRSGGESLRIKNFLVRSSCGTAKCSQDLQRGIYKSPVLF